VAQPRLPRQYQRVSAPVFVMNVPCLSDFYILLDLTSSSSSTTPLTKLDQNGFFISPHRLSREPLGELPSFHSVIRELMSQLDIQVDPKHGKEYLEKYGLNSNDAILAEEKHMPM